MTPNYRLQKRKLTSPRWVGWERGDPWSNKTSHAVGQCVKAAEKWFSCVLRGPSRWEICGSPLGEFKGGAKLLMLRECGRGGQLTLGDQVPKEKE